MINNMFHKKIGARNGLCRPAVLALCAGLLASADTASAAVANVYFYNNPNSGLRTTLTPGIGDDNYAEAGFGNMADDQATRWTNLLHSGHVLGSSSSARGKDVLEDYELNWTTPALLAGPNNRGRWQLVDTNGTFNTQYATPGVTVNAGPQPNETLRGNSAIIAMDSEGAIFLDDDNTLSYYNLVNGGLAADFTWTNLSGAGGTLGAANTAFSTTLITMSYVGCEDGYMAFLVGDNTLEYYNRANGVFLASTDYSGATAGPLTV